MNEDRFNEQCREWMVDSTNLRKLKAFNIRLINKLIMLSQCNSIDIESQLLSIAESVRQQLDLIKEDKLNNNKH